MNTSITKTSSLFMITGGCPVWVWGRAHGKGLHMAGLVWLSNIHINSAIHIIKVRKRRSMWGARFKTMVYFISSLMVIHILSCAFHYNLKCLLDFLSQLLWAFIIMKIKLCIYWYYSTVQINLFLWIGVITFIDYVYFIVYFSKLVEFNYLSLKPFLWYPGKEGYAL